MVAYNNVGANCHILKVAAGNLQLIEKTGWMWTQTEVVRIAIKDKMPNSIHRAPGANTVIISQIITLTVRQSAESQSKVLETGLDICLLMEHRCYLQHSALYSSSNNLSHIL